MKLSEANLLEESACPTPSTVTRQKALELKRAVMNRSLATCRLVCSLELTYSNNSALPVFHPSLQVSIIIGLPSDRRLHEFIIQIIRSLRVSWSLGPWT